MSRRESVGDERLFRSAVGMAEADNYADWTFSLFAPYIRGDVLEVGCGVGTYTERLVGSAACNHLVSIDITDAAVEHCRRMITSEKVEFRVADVRAVRGSFDLVICMNVLEHIEDDAAALRHMLELLRPGASLFLLVPAHPILFTAFDEAAGHYRRYTKHALATLVAKAVPATWLNLRQFYFNSIGALGYFAVYKLMGKEPQGDSSGEIGWFDRYIVPVARRLEGSYQPFGISLVAVMTRTAAR